MTKIARHYDHPRDYQRVGDFLTDTYLANGGPINWLQPRWEYMHFHPAIAAVDLACFGLWEADGEIVAVAHLEHDAGTAFFEVGPDRSDLKAEMLAYAEEHLSMPTRAGKALTLYVDDRDLELQALVGGSGYSKRARPETLSRLLLPAQPATSSLPSGFRLTSLAEESDAWALHRLLYRGFNHGDEPPDDGVAESRVMRSAPNYEPSLHIVVQSPAGGFASYCGTWYAPVNGIAYVEPVATDPDFRRMGLAAAAILEGLRRCASSGATVAYVGSAQAIYRSLGFQPVSNHFAWQREWS